MLIKQNCIIVNKFVLLLLTSALSYIHTSCEASLLSRKFGNEVGGSSTTAYWRERFHVFLIFGSTIYYMVLGRSLCHVSECIVTTSIICERMKDINANGFICIISFIKFNFDV